MVRQNGTGKVENLVEQVPGLEHANNSIGIAAARMADEETDILFVVDADELVGRVTAFDIVTRGIAEERDLQKTPLSEIMDKTVPFCRLNDTAERAARMMAEGNHTRLAVLNDEDELMGVVAAARLASAAQDVSVGSLLDTGTEEADERAREKDRRADPSGGKSRNPSSYSMARYSLRPKLRRQEDTSG